MAHSNRVCGLPFRLLQSAALPHLLPFARSISNSSHGAIIAPLLNRCFQDGGRTSLFSSSSSSSGSSSPTSFLNNNRRGIMRRRTSSLLSIFSQDMALSQLAVRNRSSICARFVPSRAFSWSNNNSNSNNETSTTTTTSSSSNDSTSSSPSLSSSQPPPPPPPPPQPQPSLLKSFAELSKVRLSSLVVLTSGAGFLLAGGNPYIDWMTCLAAVTGTSLAAAAANTFNQVYEVRTDALMKRTQNRPLPAGRLSRGTAIAFGTATMIASVSILLVGTNPLTAALGLGNIILYACIYTPMKQWSTYNTAVGAIVGAIPPLMGWAAATGSVIGTVDPFLISYALFAWQFPHFYALAWTLRKDYARGGYMMVPVVDATNGKYTATLALRHSLGLALVPILSSVLGVTNPMFAIEGLILNGYLVHLARKFYKDPGDHTARPLFRTTLWYLPLLLALMVFHANSWAPRELANSDSSLHGQGSSSSSASSSLRGQTYGAAIDHAVSLAREVGRSVCAHEVFIQMVGIARAHQLGHTLGVYNTLSTTSTTGAAITTMEQESGGNSDDSSDESSGVVNSTQHLLHQAENASRVQTRAMCPVSTAEDAAAVTAAAVTAKKMSVLEKAT